MIFLYYPNYFFKTINFVVWISVPESKQHMVLPEIEEEEEDLNQRHSKLSLTSLLLGKTFLYNFAIAKLEIWNKTQKKSAKINGISVKWKWIQLSENAAVPMVRNGPNRPSKCGTGMYQYV